MFDTIAFVYPPGPSSGEPICYAPLCQLGLGTGNAAVIDHQSGRSVQFRLKDNGVTLIHGVACVACRSVQFVDGVHFAKLPDGKPVWVRDVRDVFDAAKNIRPGDTAA